jgi:hypothetical protein
LHFMPFSTYFEDEWGGCKSGRVGDNQRIIF